MDTVLATERIFSGVRLAIWVPFVHPSLPHYWLLVVLSTFQGNILLPLQRQTHFMHIVYKMYMMSFAVLRKENSGM